MTIRAEPSETVRVRAVYTINGDPAEVNPVPTVRLVTPAGNESSPGSATLRNGTGNVPVYDYDFSSSTTGTHLVVFETTDANADAQVFAEDIIVSTGGGGGSLTAAQVWAYTTRTLTDVQGMTIIQAAVDAVGNIQIRRGDSYSTARGNPIKWVSADYATLNVNQASSVTFRMRIGDSVFSKAMTIFSTTEVRLELTTAETEAFLLGQYQYDVSAVWTNAPNDVVTLASGYATIVGDV
jgi:hypothetical protein